MSIISALPFNLTNGSTADATQVMANFNDIVNGVNSNAVAASGGSLTLAAITNSTINSTPIGQTSPSTGAFTNITASGTLGAGATTLSSTLGVTGATTLSSTLSTTGLTTATGGLTLGALLTFTTPPTVASASTVDLGAQVSNVLDISGTTPITSFGSTAVAGQEFDVRFTGALVLTYNATSLILPSSANITTAAGDNAKVRALSGGNFVITRYQRATGLALIAPTPIISKSFISTAQTITNSTTVPIAHGLGVQPTIVNYYIKCITAEFGFSVGDIVQVSPNTMDGGTARGFGAKVDTTNVNIIFSNGQGNPVLWVIRPDFTNNSLTDANWQFYVNAYA